MRYPVLFVLDEDGEANGTTRYYCSTWCRDKASRTNEDSVAEGMEDERDIISDTRCEYCYQRVTEKRANLMCNECFNRGWILADNCTHGLRIERCDTCKLYKDDESAVKVVAAHAIAWENEKGS